MPTVDISVSEDSFVFGWEPNTNFGAYPYVRTEQALASSLHSSRAWLKFNLSGLPANAVITEAKLYMYDWWQAGDLDYAPYLDRALYSLNKCTNDAWTEGTITWNNAPNEDVIPIPTLTFYLEKPDAPKWINFTVTQDVIDEFAGNKIISWRLKTDELQHDYYQTLLIGSKEYTHAWKPTLPAYLKVTYTVPETKTTTYSLDSDLLKILTTTLTLDSILLKNLTTDETISGILSKNFAIITTLDGSLKSIFISIENLDSILSKMLVKESEISSVLSKSLTSVVSLNAILWKSLISLEYLDSALSKTFYKFAQWKFLSAVLLKTQGMNINLNSVLLRTLVKTIDLDSVLQPRLSKLELLDAILQILISKSIVLDSSVYKEKFIEFLANSIIVFHIEISLDINAIIIRLVNSLYNLNALLEKSLETSIATDSTISIRNIKAYTLISNLVLIRMYGLVGSVKPDLELIASLEQGSKLKKRTLLKS